MQQEIIEIKKEVTGLLDRLDALLKKGETKFEVGKWYKCLEERLLFISKYTNGDKRPYRAFGFGCDGDWYKESDWILEDQTKLVPATKEEIQAALIEEFKRKGMAGARIKTLDRGDNGDRWGTSLNYDMASDKLYGDSGGCGIVYQKGVWAEIIKEEKIEIGGYEVKCQKFSVGQPTGTYAGTYIDNNFFHKNFWEAAKTISEHSKAKIMVGCSKQFDVSLDTINAILKKL